MGYSTAKNEGIIVSKGAFIAMIDADDMLTPKSIEIRLNHLLKRPNSLWVHGNAYDLHPNGKKTPDKFFPLRWQKNFKAGKYHLLGACVHAQCVMSKREFYFKVGLYDEELRASSDREMWKRAVALGYIPEYSNNFVAIYRLHKKQMSKSKWKIKNRSKLWGIVNKNIKNRVENGINKKNTRLLYE